MPRNGVGGNTLKTGQADLFAAFWVVVLQDHIPMSLSKGAKHIL
jgi:hypothetical protein